MAAHLAWTDRSSALTTRLGSRPASGVAARTPKPRSSRRHCCSGRGRTEPAVRVPVHGVGADRADQRAHVLGGAHPLELAPRMLQPPWNAEPVDFVAVAGA